jgi:hypothetical protein
MAVNKSTCEQKLIFHFTFSRHKMSSTVTNVGIFYLQSSLYGREVSVINCSKVLKSSATF